MLGKIFGYDSDQSRSMYSLDFKYVSSNSGAHIHYDEQQLRDKAFYEQGIQLAIGDIDIYIAELELEIIESDQASTNPLTHLHPTVQDSVGSLCNSAHYPQAILAACPALNKAVQAKAQLPANTIGTALMIKAFSANQPDIRLTQDTMSRWAL
jgi:hypothetical protein